MSKETSTIDELRQVKNDLRVELRQRKFDASEDGVSMTSDNDNSSVTEISENHFRLNLGQGFGLDLVILYSSSLAFTSFGGNLLELKTSTGWPGSLFNPVVGQA